MVLGMETQLHSVRSAPRSVAQQLGRRWSMAMLAMMPLALAALPAAHAAAPDGVYKVTRVFGSATVNGRVVEIPEGILKDAFSQNGRITIRNSRLPLYRAKWAEVMEQFNDFGLNGKVTTSGPTSVLLAPAGKSFTGRTSKPVRLALEGSFLITKVTLNTQVNFRAKVTGNKLTITAPITVASPGLLEAKGKVTLVARK